VCVTVVCYQLDLQQQSLHGESAETRVGHSVQQRWTQEERRGEEGEGRKDDEEEGKTARQLKAANQRKHSDPSHGCGRDQLRGRLTGRPKVLCCSCGSPLEERGEERGGRTVVCGGPCDSLSAAEQAPRRARCCRCRAVC
jgi:hypothetical protein